MPTNVSFETALRVPADGSSVLQDETHAEQVDYYVFEAEAGGYYEITTDRHRFSPDNLIALFDEQLELLAENDEGERWGGDAIDARLLVQAKTSGDHYVRVEDLWTPQRFFVSDFPLLYYHLSVRKLEAGSEGIAIAGAEGRVEVELATDEASGFRYATLIGVPQNGSASFELQGADEAVIGRVLRAETPILATGKGWREVELLDAEQTVIANILSDLGQEELHPPVSRARYELHVIPDASGDIEQGAFYAIDIVLVPENPLEASDGENGTPEGAEPIEMEGTSWRRGLLLTTLPDDDVDYFRFEADAGSRALAVCEGESGGSRLRGLRAELLDDALTSLGAGEESPTANLEIEAAVLERTGTYYLRLSTTPHEAQAAAAWARCSITVLP
jgi:hypothetical protein